jgi:hypothetical protein
MTQQSRWQTRNERVLERMKWRSNIAGLELAPGDPARLPFLEGPLRLIPQRLDQI